MGIIRNSINVVGLAKEDELLTSVNGHIYKHSEVETLSIPAYKSEAKSLQEIEISLNLDNTRLVEIPGGKMLSIGGEKEYKLSYLENSPEGLHCTATIQLPYYTFVELPIEYENVSKINVFIVDAYFQLIEPRKIYVHFVYILDIVRGDEPSSEAITHSDSIEETYAYQSDESDGMLYDLAEEIL